MLAMLAMKAATSRLGERDVGSDDPPPAVGGAAGEAFDGLAVGGEEVGGLAAALFAVAVGGAGFHAGNIPEGHRR